jgi:ATP-binding cassette subfamily B protein
MHPLRRLLPYYRRYGLPFTAGNALLLGSRGFEAAIPGLLGAGIDRIATGRPAGLAIAFGILACVAGRFAAILVGRRAIRRIGVAVAYDLRNRLYAHLERQGPGFFARYRTGDLMARAINDIGLVRQLVAQGTRTALVLGFSGLIGLACMFHESTALALWILPPLPLVFAVAWWLSGRLRAESMGVQEGFSELSERVQENLGGIRTIQALTQEEAEILRFAAVNDRYARRNLELVTTGSRLAAWMPGLGALCTLTVLIAGGRLVQTGELSLGAFTAFLWYLGMLLWPVREAGNVVNLFQRGFAGCDRLFELLDTPPEIADPLAPDAPLELAGRIELSHVSARYPGSARPALEDVSLSLAAGEWVGIVGRVGAGKSTLLRLLVRLLEPSLGEIKIDGFALARLPLAVLRSRIALVPQEAFLFSESLRANVAYDDATRAPAEVHAAAEAADLWDTLSAFPEGLETRVGERGITLSGGQKQRVTLARSFVRDTPVLLLDDAFSSLDAATGSRVLRRLRELRRGRTTLLVSHRVSAVREADRIIVLEAGRVLESGSPAELRARGGAFAELERAQGRREQLLRELAKETGGEAA